MNGEKPMKGNCDSCTTNHKGIEEDLTIAKGFSWNKYEFTVCGGCGERSVHWIEV